MRINLVYEVFITCFFQNCYCYKHSRDHNIKIFVVTHRVILFKTAMVHKLSRDRIIKA